MQTDSFQTILCPVDFSELSANALREAMLLATCETSRVVAIYADWVEAPAYFTESQMSDLEEELRKSVSDARRSLREFVDSVVGPGAPIDVEVVEGAATDAILVESAKRAADLIVMGTHGRTGWNRWTLGSVTERVLRGSSVPVLTVRREPPAHVRSILCAVDDSGESRAALARAASLASCFDATVTVLHVDEPHGRLAIPNLCSWVPADARARCVIRELSLRGNAAEEIVRLTTQNTYDLLLLGAPKRRFFEGMISGTTATRAVRHAACPVLSVPGRA